MGYTHYWRCSQPSELNDWDLKIADCDKIIAACKDKYELNLEGSNDTRIWLNGPDDDRDLGHETFGVPRHSSKLEAFDFCKTAQKPYDVVVVACLCALAETGLDVSSDGSHEEWEDGRKLAEQILVRPVSNPISKD